MRRTMRSRLSIAQRPLLDPLFVVASLDDALHENPRRVNAVGIERAGLDELFDFSDRMLRCCRHHRIEVARRLSINEIADAIAFPRFDECEVGMERRFENVGAPVDDATFLPFRDQRARAGRREETADTCTRGAHPLGESALRHELDFDLLLQELTLELL